MNKIFSQKIFRSNPFDHRVLYPSVYIWSMLILLFNPLENLEVTSFDRQIGIGLLNNIDVSKRVSNFYFWYFLIIPLVFVLVFMLCSSISKKRQGYEECFEFLNSFSIVSFASSILFFVNRFVIDSQIIFGFSMQVCFITIFAIFAYISFATDSKDNKFALNHKNAISLSIPFSDFRWCLVLSFALVYPIIAIFDIFDNYISLCYILNIVISVISLNVWYGAKKFSADRTNKLKFSITPLIFSILILGLSLEACNILNQYEIFIINKILYMRIIFLILIITSIVLFLTYKPKKKFDWEKIFYPAIIIGIGFIYVFPYVQTTVSTDLFEQANHGMLINDFLEFGKIPLIESFDGHMLSKSFWGIVYGIINQDTIGAIFLTYSGFNIVIFYFLGYKLLETIFNRDFAFYSIILIPLPFEISMGVVSVLVLIYAMKKNTFISYLIYWLSVVFIMLYEVPTGFSYGLGTFFTFITFCMIYRDKFDIKKYILALCSTLFACFIIYIPICIFKGIHPFVRMREFLSLISSSINWAYPIIGDPKLFVFQFLHVILPILILAAFLGLFIFIKVNKSKIDMPLIVILLSFCFAYFLNIQRGLVRHGLVEFSITKIWRCIWSALLVITLYGSIIIPKFKKEYFIFSLMFFVLFINLLISNTNYINYNLLTNSMNRWSNQATYADGSSEKVERVVMSEEMSTANENIITAINTIMDESETYIDFTNQTLLYALSGKEKPFYINQSPAHLSGEYSQEQYINEIEQYGKDVAFVLMPLNNAEHFVSIDGIPNSYRYYKVSEYISLNYRPLCAVDDYAIWCLKENYDKEYEELFGTDNIDETGLCTPIGYNYGDAKVLHTYNLMHLPYIWGMYDEKEAYLNHALTQLNQSENGRYSLDMDSIPKENGNYILLEADADAADSAILILGKDVDNVFTPLSNFYFNIEPGIGNRYLIRVSSDFHWYTEEINSVHFQSSIPLENVSIKALEGD